VTLTPTASCTPSAPTARCTSFAARASRCGGVARSAPAARAPHRRAPGATR
jgi:hypothetical protein